MSSLKGLTLMLNRITKGAVSFKFSMRNVFGKIFGKPYTNTLRPNLARKTHRSSIAFSFHRSPAVPLPPGGRLRSQRKLV